MSQFIYFQDITNSNVKIYRILLKRKRNKFNKQFLIILLRNRNTKHIKRIERHICKMAFSTLDLRLELSIKNINKKTLFSLFEYLPKFSSYFFIFSVLTILILNIWLKLDLIYIFMKIFKQG